MRARVMAVLAVPWVIAFPPGREALVTERYALFRGWRQFGAQAQVDAGLGGRPDDRELAAPGLQGHEAFPGLHGYLAWPVQGLGHLDQPVQDGARRGGRRAGRR